MGFKSKCLKDFSKKTGIRDGKVEVVRMLTKYQKKLLVIHTALDGCVKDAINNLDLNETVAKEWIVSIGEEAFKERVMWFKAAAIKMVVRDVTPPESVKSYLDMVTLISNQMR